MVGAMSNPFTLELAAVGVGAAIAALLVGARVLRKSRRTAAAAARQQPYMIQVQPPSQKVQSFPLPVQALEQEPKIEREA